MLNKSVPLRMLARETTDYLNFGFKSIIVLISVALL